MRPDIINPIIVTMMVSLMMKVLKCMGMMEDVDIGLVRPAYLPLTIAKFMVEADLGIKIQSLFLLQSWSLS